MKRLFLTITLCFLTLMAYSQTLFIYGGFNYEVFWDTLNENPQSKWTIWNEYEEYGHEFNKLSIWNEFGSYGNEASIYCPWNENSSDVPILVDALGHNYGELMLSEAYRKVFQ